MTQKAGFGGGCHWCTEAVFSVLKGVCSVQQGWIASSGENSGFSEAVLVEFDPDVIPMETLVAIHLHTHSATSSHSRRQKYRSAVYVFSTDDALEASRSIQVAQHDFYKPIVTQVLNFVDFRLNGAESLNYYFNDPKRPFCELYINPKLKLILREFKQVADDSKLGNLEK